MNKIFALSIAAAAALIAATLSSAQGETNKLDVLFQQGWTNFSVVIDGDTYVQTCTHTPKQGEWRIDCRIEKKPA